MPVQRSNNVFARSTGTFCLPKDKSGKPVANDFFLYALFARIALSNNENIEFETKFDKETQTIELQLSDNNLQLFDQLVGMKRGPKFKQFIDWLIGSRRFDSVSETDFFSATAFDIWFGATVAQIEDRNLVLFPTKKESVIGYNFKLNEEKTKAKLFLVWQYICGSNDFAELRVVANVISTSAPPMDVVNDVILDTSGLTANEVIETEILNLDVPEDSVISLSIIRCFEGSSDPQSEMIGMIGVRLEDG